MRPVDPGKAREYFEAKMAFSTGPIETERMIRLGEDINIVDVRASEDYQEGHIPGAKSLPQDRWDSFEGLSKDKTNLLYCYSQVCHLAAKAAVHFAAAGYPVMELDGGMRSWREHNLDVETSREKVGAAG